MIQLRTSQTQDIPRLRQLWKLAFGDEDSYIDHFFRRFYAPERMLVLEEDGQLQSMGALFDMPLVLSRGETFPSAYLYALATHPDGRGRGFAGQLLSFADRWLKMQGVACITTVPARPDLHIFFGQNGFREWFLLHTQDISVPPDVSPSPMRAVDTREYGSLREHALSSTDHIAYSESALAYQSGVCALTGGGLYRLGEYGCACVELSGDTAFVKELLVPEDQRAAALSAIAKQHPSQKYHLRTPYTGKGEKWEYAMIKWLTPNQPQTNTCAYLGLGFD